MTSQQNFRESCTSSTTAIYSQAFLAGLAPDEDINLAEWQDKYRILSQKGSSEPGRYRTSRTPYLREIAFELSPQSPRQRIVFMKSAQVGASELGYNWIGYVMHKVPAPMMMACPTTELAEKISKQRLSAMIEETPELKEIIGPEKSRTSGQTVLLKEFKGGVLSIVGANSPVGLRSMPVRFAFGDECSVWPKDIGGEGSGVALLEARTQTFKRRKVFLVSTPTVEGECQIQIEYLKSDQRRYHIPCPHCGTLQWLKFRQLKWTDDDPSTAKYQCEHCLEMIEERHKTQFMAEENGACWIPTVQGDGITVGYHISALYSPIGWKSWSEIVSDFLVCKTDAPRLKTWTNATLGECWSEEYAQKVGASELMERVEDYQSGTAPAGVILALMSVDVQDNRFEVSIYGWGRGEEDWLIAHQVIYGDPARPEMWKQLADIAAQPIEHETAQPIKITAGAIDSGGHFTQEVYQFCRHNRLFIAVKGSSQKGKPAISRPSKVDINYKGQALKSGGEVYMVGTDTIKAVIYGRLKHNEPGPGYSHFPIDATPDYFKQLTSEKQLTRYVKGFPVREWTKKAGDRNEVLDCKVYNYALLQKVLNQYSPASCWQILERKLIPKNKTSAPDRDVSAGQNNAPQTKIRPRKPNFVGSW